MLFQLKSQRCLVVGWLQHTSNGTVCSTNKQMCSFSPVVVKFFIDIWTAALQSVRNKPSCWFHYVDIYVVWNEGEEDLSNFLAHISGICPNIRFTMKNEEGGKLFFLDVLAVKKGLRRLHHKVRKTTHPNRYLHRVQSPSGVKTGARENSCWSSHVS